MPLSCLTLLALASAHHRPWPTWYLEISLLRNINPFMEWVVEYTDEFGAWWDTLTEAEQISVDAHVQKLESRGPNLPFPYSSGINDSRHTHMRELRVQSGGKPLRIFYAFDRVRRSC